MNKFYFLLLFLTCLGNGSLAQNNSQQEQFAKRSYTGIKGGANLSTFSGDLQNLEMQFGANAGIYALYMESEHFGIQPEIQYSLQGTGEKGRGHLLMHYLAIPIMLKYYPAPTFSIQAGPYAALLLKSKYEYEAIDMTDNKAKGNDFGFAYGFSVGNESKLTFGVRHHVGLSSIYKDFKAYNQTVQASLSFCFSQK
jgi:hypothetical protein